MKRIILVEDDEAIREIFQLVFRNDDYQLINLANGDKIVNCEIDAPDLFIFDKQVSGTNGIELCRFIRKCEKYNEVPVIMISASPGILVAAKDCCVDDATSKPFSIKKLREMIIKYVG